MRPTRRVLRPPVRAAGRRAGEPSSCLAALALVALLALLPGPTPLVAQQAPAAGVPRSDEPTSEWLEQQLEALALRTDGDAAQRGRAKELFEQALGQLRAAGEAARLADQWERAGAEAPARLEEIRASLALPPAPVEALADPDADVADLEQRLSEVRAALAAAEEEAAELEAERETRSARRVEIPKTLADLRLRLDETVIGAQPDDPPFLVEARRALAAATRQALAAAIRADEQELHSYEVRGDLLRARQDLSARRIAEARAAVDAWTLLVQQRRRLEVEAAAEEAQATRRAAANAHPAVRELAAHNEAFAGRRQELSAEIEQAGRALEQVREAQADIQAKSSLVRHRVDRAGFTDVIAVLLQRHRAELPDLRELRASRAQRQETTARAQVEQLDLDDERERLASLDAALDDLLEGVDGELDEVARAELRASARELLERRRELVDDLIDDVDAFLDRLVDLDVEEKQLIATTEDYGRFIDEHILWVRSVEPFQRRNAVAFGETLLWLGDPRRWTELGATLLRHAFDVPESYALFVAGALAVVLVGRTARRRLRELGERVARQRLVSLASMLAALLLTLLWSATWPVLFALAGWVLRAAPVPELGAALGTALSRIVSLVLLLAVLGNLCRPYGVGETVLKWRAPALRAVRRHLRLLTAVLLPSLLVAYVLEAQENLERHTSLGRLALVVALGSLAVFQASLLRSSGALGGATRSSTGAWTWRLRGLWYPLAVGVPVGLALVALFGYQYAGLQLGRRLLESNTLVLTVLVLHGIVMRWLVMQKRRLRVEQAARRRQSEEEEPPVETSGEISALLDENEDEIDLETVDAQVQKLVRVAAGFTLLLGLSVIWIEVLPALGALEHVTLWRTAMPGAEGEGEVLRPVSLADLLLALLTVGLTVFAARNLPGLLEITVLQRLQLEPGGGYAVTTVCRYLITIVGIVVAFATIGITWDKVQFLAAAITVGLGFGLQEIFANFVSGLMILFERPVRVGDIVTVGATDGVVTKIRMRATTIRDWDNRELLVPNKEFITSQVVNWTLSDPVTRVIFRIGLAAGSDTRLATQELLRLAREHPLVLGSPEPSVVFRGFGESTLDFELRLFIGKRDHWPAVTHDLNTSIDDAFRKLGIEIAFPQRDLHVRTFGAKVRFEPVAPVEDVVEHDA